MALRRALLIRAARTGTRWWASRLHNPVFVIGCARSGTAVLSDWLSNFRDIANLSEATDIWDPSGFPWAKSPNGRNSPPIWIDPQAHSLRWWHDTENRGQEIRAIFGVYQMVKRAKVFVNK